MTISNRQLIYDALGMLGILAETEVASAEQAQQGLRTLNAFMAEWQELDIMPSYYTQQQDELANDCPIPESEEMVVTAALAVRLSAYYKGSDPTRAAAIAGNGYRRLLRTLLTDTMPEADMSHRVHHNSSDILNG